MKNVNSSILNFLQVIKNDRKLIADDRVNLDIIVIRKPHPISPYDRLTSLPYQIVTDTIDQLFDNVVHGPGTFFKHYSTEIE